MPAKPREGQQRGNLADKGRGLEERLVETSHPRLAAAGLTVGEVARHLAALPDSELADQRGVVDPDDRLDALAAPSADELAVLLAQPAAGTEQVALDHRLGHVESLADLGVGEAGQLAHDDDLVMGLRQAVEGAPETLERLLGLDLAVGGRVAVDRRALAAVVVEVALGGQRDLTHAARSAELIDARVLGDLVDPWLEGDRLVGLAHPSQGGDEDLLDEVLGTSVIPHHAEDVGRDPGPVARVELLERLVTSLPDGSDKVVLGARRGGLGHA